jgi:hypothetical protein
MTMLASKLLISPPRYFLPSALHQKASHAGRARLSGHPKRHARGPPAPGQRIVANNFAAAPGLGRMPSVQALRREAESFLRITPHKDVVVSPSRYAVHRGAAENADDGHGRAGDPPGDRRSPPRAHPPFHVAIRDRERSPVRHHGQCRGLLRESGGRSGPEAQAFCRLGSIRM